MCLLKSAAAVTAVLMSKPFCLQDILLDCSIQVVDYNINNASVMLDTSHASAVTILLLDLSMLCYQFTGQQDVISCMALQAPYARLRARHMYCSAKCENHEQCLL